MPNKENKQRDYQIKHTQTYAHWFLSETKTTCCRFRQLNRDDICMMCSQIMTIQFGKQTTLLQLRHPITVHSVTLHHNIPSSCLATHQCFLLQHVKQDMGSQVQLWSPTWERGQRWLTNHLCTLPGGAVNPLVKSNVKDAFTQTGWASLTDTHPLHATKETFSTSPKKLSISWAAAEMKNSNLWGRVWPVLSHTKTSTVKDISWQAVPEL